MCYEKLGFSPYNLFIPKTPASLNSFYTFIIFLSSFLPPFTLPFPPRNRGSALQISKLSLCIPRISAVGSVLCAPISLNTMGILFTRMLSSLFGNREARILVLGLDNAGKTTILCILYFTFWVCVFSLSGGFSGLL